MASKKINKKSTNDNRNTALIIAAVILLIINIGLYWKFRNYDFVWDDHHTHLHSNKNLMEDNVGEFWKKPYTGLYIPVSYTTWNWIKDLSFKDVNGRRILDAKTFHSVNIFLHAFNSLLVLYLLYLLSSSSWASFAGALLFSVHPVQVESVAWISEYRGLLSSFFSLIAIIFYYYFRKKNKRYLFFWSTSMFILALLSKPSVIILPFIASAFDYFVFKVSKKEYLFPGIWLIIAIPLMAITSSAQPAASLDYFPPFWTRPFIAADSISFYLYKFFLPFNLSASYGRTPEAVMNEWYFYVLWIVPVALLYLIWKLKDNEPLIASGIFIFIVGVLPVSGLLNFDFQKFSTVADRYLYLSIIGAAIVLARLFQKYNNQKWIYYAGSTVAIVYLFINSNQQKTWKDDLTLWKTTAEQNPGQAHVHNNYGISLHDAGKFDEAINQYNLALQSRPEFASAYNNRGNSFAFKRDFQNALKDQSKAIEIDPGYGRAWFNRAVTHFQLGNLGQALNDLNEAEKRGYKPHPQFRMDLEREMRKRK